MSNRRNDVSPPADDRRDIVQEATTLPVDEISDPVVLAMRVANMGSLIFRLLRELEDTDPLYADARTRGESQLRLALKDAARAIAKIAERSGSPCD